MDKVIYYRRQEGKKMRESKLSRRQLLKKSHVIKYGDVGGILIIEFGIIGLYFCLNLPTELTGLETGNFLFFIGLCTLGLIGWGLLGYYKDLYDIVHGYTYKGYGVVKRIYKEKDKKESSPYKVDIEIEDMELDKVMKDLGITKKAGKKYIDIIKEGIKTFYVYDTELVQKLGVGKRIEYTSLCTKDLLVEIHQLTGGINTIEEDTQYESIDEFKEKREKENIEIDKIKTSTKRKIESGIFVLGLLVINGILLELFKGIF